MIRYYWCSMDSSKLLSWLLLFFGLSICLACGSGGNTDSEEGGDDAGDDSGDATELEATLSSIEENILTPNCATSGCHAGSGQAGLVLEAGSGFANLVGVSSTQSDLNRVEAGDPEASYLVHKLEGTQSSVGGSGVRMPKGASALSDTEIQAIRDWITNGALDD